MRGNCIRVLGHAALDLCLELPNFCRVWEPNCGSLREIESDRERAVRQQNLPEIEIIGLLRWRNADRLVEGVHRLVGLFLLGITPPQQVIDLTGLAPGGS